MSENGVKRVTILSIPIDRVSLRQATKIAIELANGNKKCQIATPNPEFLLEAQKNPIFLKILQKSKLNIPDGIGLLWASKYQKIAKNRRKIVKIAKWLQSLLSVLFRPKSIREVLAERVTGIDLMQEICKISTENDFKIFLLGSKEGIATYAKEVLEKKHKNIKIVGTYSGSPSREYDEKITKMINQAKPNILFVAYGAPAQEIWIDRNIKRLNTVRIAIGVGGAFDFIVGNRKRAPKLMQQLGLEWLFRLIQEPSRIKRIYNAAIKFPITILTHSLKKE